MSRRQNQNQRAWDAAFCTLALVDGGAESPYESLTRVLLVQNGFPKPSTQIAVEYLVGVDFEGAHHWSDSKPRSWDVDRFARPPELGWQDFRLTSGILHTRPRPFLDRFGAALIARGCPKTW